MSGVDEADSCKLNDGCLFGGFCCHNFIAEVHYFVAAIKSYSRSVCLFIDCLKNADLPDIISESTID